MNTVKTTLGLCAVLTLQAGQEAPAVIVVDEAGKASFFLP